MMNNANNEANVNATTCTCGNFGCQKRIARGIAPFCRMNAPKAAARIGFPTYRDALDALSMLRDNGDDGRIVLVSGGYNSGTRTWFNIF